MEASLADYEPDDGPQVRALVEAIAAEKENPPSAAKLETLGRQLLAEAERIRQIKKSPVRRRAERGEAGTPKSASKRKPRK